MSRPETNQRIMKRSHVILVAALVAFGTAAVISPFALRAGYHRGLGREKATLVLTLNALEGMRAGKDITGIVENACFTAALPFLEDAHYRSDIDITGATPRLIKYWDAYWADRPERPVPTKHLESLLNQRR